MRLLVCDINLMHLKFIGLCLYHMLSNAQKHFDADRLLDSCYAFVWFLLYISLDTT